MRAALAHAVRHEGLRGGEQQKAAYAPARQRNADQSDLRPSPNAASIAFTHGLPSAEFACAISTRPSRA